MQEQKQRHKFSDKLIVFIYWISFVSYIFTHCFTMPRDCVKASVISLLIQGTPYPFTVSVCTLHLQNEHEHIPHILHTELTNPMTFWLYYRICIHPSGITYRSSDNALSYTPDWNRKFPVCSQYNFYHHEHKFHQLFSDLSYILPVFYDGIV